MVAAALDMARKTLPPIVASDGVEIEIHDGIGPPPPPMVVLQWSLWLIVHGRADVRIAGRSREIRPGAVATARPGDVLSVARRRTDRMRAVHVTLWPEAVAGCVPTHAPLQSVTHDPALTATVHELVRVLGGTSPSRLEARRALAGIVLSLEPGAAKSTPAVERTRAILDTDYAHDHKLEDLARIAGVSKYHLIRAFHADLGVTP
ncbi:MAG: AraC family ligand binding domain-containing protein, partial [Polyangiales bacterium]